MPVYFIAENESGDYDNLRVKIGISGDISKRLGQLQTGSPYKLKLMGWIEPKNDRDLEKDLHKKYEKYNSHLEWFNLGASEVLEELKLHSTKSFIAVNENVFEVASYDRKGIAEFIGAWQWSDVEYDEFCPSCGWSGGLDYNENFGGERCLNCGLIANNL